MRQNNSRKKARIKMACDIVTCAKKRIKNDSQLHQMEFRQNYVLKNNQCRNGHKMSEVKRTLRRNYWYQGCRTTIWPWLKGCSEKYAHWKLQINKLKTVEYYTLFENMFIKVFFTMVVMVLARQDLISLLDILLKANMSQPLAKLSSRMHDKS